MFLFQVEIKRVEMRDKNASNGQWSQNIMVNILICY